MFGAHADAERARAEEFAVSVLKPFTDNGVKVVFEAPKPLYRSPPFRCADWFDKDNPICAPGFDMPRATLQALREPVLRSYASIAQRLPGVEVWDPFPILCPGETCKAFDGDKPLFLDADHLSGHGNMVLLPSFSAFMGERLGRYPASRDEPMVFNKAGIPDFLTQLTGFSHVEGWGRWTDARLGTAALTFARPLPSSFVLRVSAMAYGPNAGRPVRVTAGGVTREVVFEGGQSTVDVPFEGVRGNTIEFAPPEPTSPSASGASGDPRLLGLGITSVQVQTGAAAGLARASAQ
jgi:hypothetical protein